MQVSNAVRATVISEVIAELRRFGHHYSAQHVDSCRERLLARHAGEQSDLVRHRTSGQAEGSAVNH